MSNNLGLHHRYNSYRVCFGPFDTVFVIASSAHNAIVYASHDHPDLVNLCKSSRRKITAVLA